MKFPNLVGRVFGKWTVISKASARTFPGGQSHRRWNCACRCGNKKAVFEPHLKSGRSSGCGRCFQRVDLTGKKLGRLVVVGKALHPRKRVVRVWKCKCSCGRLKLIGADSFRLGTKSCGHCIQETHGYSRTKVYAAYRDMKSRCRNRNARNYKFYGGRGIKVCARWSGKQGFQRFLSDMGEPPKSHELDRRDHCKDYSPRNCRWATKRDGGPRRARAI